MTTTLHEGATGFGEMDGSPETFEKAFEAAREEVYGVGFEDDFIALCAERGLDPLNEDHPNDRNPIANEGAYAATVSDYMHRKLQAERERLDYNGDRIVPERDLIVRELAASTADFVYSQMRLSSLPPQKRHEQNHRKTPDERHQDETRRRIVDGALRLASHYNGLIRTTAQEFPDVTPSQMTKKIAQVANITLRHPALRQNSPNSVGSAVRGAQFEITHGQILEKSGVWFRDTSLEEDLYGGADYIAQRNDGSDVRINIKASKHNLKDMGIRGDYGYDRKDTLIVNVLNDDEIGDSFTISDAMATRKAPIMYAAVNSYPPASQARYSR